MQRIRFRRAPTLVWAGVIASSLAAAPSAAAGTLTLTSGERLAGTLAAEQPGQVQLVSDRFGEIGIDLQIMAAYETTAKVFVDLDTGERLTADGMTANGERIALRTRFGEIDVAWEEVSGIEEVANDTVSVPVSSDGPVEQLRPFPKQSISATVGYLSNQTTQLFGGRRDQFSSVRLGYTRNLTALSAVSAEIPYASKTVRVTDFGEEVTDSSNGFGDISLSVSQIFLGSGLRPHIRTALNVGLPTGSAGVPSDRALSGFSSGDWSAGLDVMVQQPLDGGSLIAGVGYTRYWPQQNTSETANAEEFEWTVGYEVGLSPKVSLTGAVSGSTFKRAEERTEPAYLMLATSFITESGLVLTPTYANGLNVDSQDFMIGMSVSRSW